MGADDGQGENAEKRREDKGRLYGEFGWNKGKKQILPFLEKKKVMTSWTYNTYPILQSFSLEFIQAYHGYLAFQI